MPTTFDDLSPARQRLALLLRDLRFGQVRDLTVVAGEPVFDPPPHLVRHRQLGAVDRVLPPLGPQTRLKPHLEALCAELDDLGSGIIETIKVQDGLPVHLQVALPATR